MSASEPKLLDRLRDACRVRHYSIRTEDAYHDWCRRFILFHNKRHPQEMGEAEINAFLTHLPWKATWPPAPRTRRCRPCSSCTGT
jgi:hypothetical protein